LNTHTRSKRIDQWNSVFTKKGDKSPIKLFD